MEGILIRQAGRLDWDHILHHLRPLAELKGAPGIVVELENRRRELDPRSPPPIDD